MYKFPSLDNTLTHLKKSKTKTFFNVFIYLFLIYPGVSATIHKKKRRASDMESVCERQCDSRKLGWWFSSALWPFWLPGNPLTQHWCSVLSHYTISCFIWLYWPLTLRSEPPGHTTPTAHASWHLSWIKDLLNRELSVHRKQRQVFCAAECTPS